MVGSEGDGLGDAVSKGCEIVEWWGVDSSEKNVQVSTKSVKPTKSGVKELR